MQFRTLLLLLLCIPFFLGIVIAAAASGTETRISFSADPFCNNVRPSADNGWVVWQEQCPGMNRIIAYNYLTGVQLTLPNATLNSYSPNIRNRRVVWYEEEGGGFTALYYANLTENSPVAHRLDVPISAKTNPVTDGNIIAWENKATISSPTSDILMYNLSSSTLFTITPGTPGSSQRYPSVSGNRIVWLDNRNGQRDIFLNNTYAGWATLNLTPGIPGPGQNRPMTAGNRIIWYDDTYTIFLNNLTKTVRLPSFSAGHRVSNIVVCGTYYAWKENTGGIFGRWDVFVNNSVLSMPPDQITGPGSLPFVGDPDESLVAITPDSRVFWVDDRRGWTDIYMFTYGPTGACPVADFTASPTEGPSPLFVSFSDSSSGSPTHWRWEFGDGNTADGRNESHRYTRNGIYPARLITGNARCRNASAPQTISVGIPSVDFTGTPVEGIAPLEVSFRGTATGSPGSWLWNFGDGGTSILQNPAHVYTGGGTYDVSLTATNAYGSTMRTRPRFIAARNGSEIFSFTNITGLSVSGTGSGQTLTLNTTLLPVHFLSADNRTLRVSPPQRFGWREIVFRSAESTGFTVTPSAVDGRIASADLKVRDIVPVNFTTGVGRNIRIGYSTEHRQYSAPAYLRSRVWEGTFPSDDAWFNNIIHGSGFSSKKVGYTLNISRHNLSMPSRLMLNMSAATAWVRGNTTLESGRCQTYVIAMGYNADGDLLGSVLPARYTGNDSVRKIEYFETEIPAQYLFFSTFGLAELSGSGNPLQLITLTVTQHAEQPQSVNSPPPAEHDESAEDKGPGKGPAVTTPAGTPVPTPTSDPGRSAKVYTNANGTVTQATLLRSADGLATISIGKGTVAKDAQGKPLSVITLKALPPDSLPAIPPGSSLSYAGMAYDLGPDGSTFAPHTSFSLAPPGVRWGHDYTVRSFDGISGTWQDLPTSFNTTTGTITAEVSHLCTFALFSRPAPSAVTAGTAVPTQPGTPQLPAAPPAGAIGTFANMLEWIIVTISGNMVISIGIVILIIAAFLYRQGKFPGSGL